MLFDEVRLEVRGEVTVTSVRLAVDAEEKVPPRELLSGLVCMGPETLLLLSRREAEIIREAEALPFVKRGRGIFFLHSSPGRIVSVLSAKKGFQADCPLLALESRGFRRGDIIVFKIPFP